MDTYIEIEKLNGIVLYDGVCKFCNGSVNFLISHEKGELLKFSPLQSSLCKKLALTYEFDTNELNTIFFIKNQKAYSKSSAIFLLSDHMKFPWNLVSIFKYLPRFITDFFYDVISKNRYSIFGKSDSCMVPSSEIRNRFLD